jgi:hypothetical protein
MTYEYNASPLVPKHFALDTVGVLSFGAIAPQANSSRTQVASYGACDLIDAHIVLSSLDCAGVSKGLCAKVVTGDAIR